MFFAKNGVVVVFSEITRKISVAGDVGAAALVCAADCNQNDYVEVGVDTDISNPNITLQKTVLMVEGV